MSTFLERLEQEENELASRIISLQVFMGTDAFEELSEGNQYLLDKQLEAMTEYISILFTRIELNSI